MRILHVGKFFPPHPGGMEVFLADLIDAQHRQGLDEFGLTHAAEAEHHAPSEIRRQGRQHEPGQQGREQAADRDVHRQHDFDAGHQASPHAWRADAHA